MKTLKKLLCLTLSFLMVFSLVSVSCFAASQEENKVTLSADDGFYSQIKAAVEKIKGFFLGVVEKLRALLGIGYSSVNVREFKENAFAVPGLEEDFIPQGICYIESIGSFAVSGYVKGDDSRIYIVDEETNESKKLIIDGFTGHAGGITSNGDDVWVSSGGSETKGGYVYHLSASYLNDAVDGTEISFDGSFQTECSGSTIFCDGEKLIVAEFYERNDYIVNKSHAYGDNHAWGCGYELPISADAYNGGKLTPDFILSLPDKVQGLSITDDGNVILSSSYGRNNDSTMYIYKPYTEWKTASAYIDGKSVTMYVAEDEGLIDKVKMPTLMEGIDFANGNLYVLFESGAKTYSDAKEIIKDVWSVDMSALVKQVKENSGGIC